MISCESLKKFLRKLEVDKAVFFGALSRLWQIIAGPITAILIATQFSAELQGFYYTFGSILALQVFVELGLGVVIIQFASHEWSLLELDRNGDIVGDSGALSRLRSIARIALQWYSVGALLLFVGLSIGGYLFFSSTPNIGISWRAPWLTLCVVAGGNIALVPVWSLLEGCNQVSRVYTYRFVQGIVTNLSVWSAMLLGADLWTAPISGMASFLLGALFLTVFYRQYIVCLFLLPSDGPKISWRTHMLPMQWRIALSWASGYFVFTFFTPVLFKYHGPQVAGQFGMTWSIVGMMGALAGSWLAPRAPQFGILIAQKRYVELDKLFWKITKIVTGITVVIASLAWVFVYVLNAIHHPLALKFSSRLLSPLPTGFLLFAQVLQIISTPFSTYMRAHKQEPIMHLSVLAAVMIGLSTLILGKHYSATGASFGYMAVNAAIIPLVFSVWRKCRLMWH